MDKGILERDCDTYFITRIFCLGVFLNRYIVKEKDSSEGILYVYESCIGRRVNVYLDDQKKEIYLTSRSKGNMLFPKYSVLDRLASPIGYIKVKFSVWKPEWIIMNNVGMSIASICPNRKAGYGYIQGKRVFNFFKNGQEVGNIEINFNGWSWSNPYPWTANLDLTGDSKRYIDRRLALVAVFLVSGYAEPRVG